MTEGHRIDALVVGVERENRALGRIHKDATLQFLFVQFEVDALTLRSNTEWRFRLRWFDFSWIGGQRRDHRLILQSRLLKNILQLGPSVPRLDNLRCSNGEVYLARVDRCLRYHILLTSQVLGKVHLRLRSVLNNAHCVRLRRLIVLDGVEDKRRRESRLSLIVRRLYHIREELIRASGL